MIGFSLVHNAADSASRGWALIWDFLRDKPIIGSLFTAAFFFRHPKQITRDAIAERWGNHLKPPRFLIESYAVCLCILPVTPFKDLISGSVIGDNRRHFLLFANVIAYAVLHHPAMFAVVVTTFARRLKRDWRRCCRCRAAKKRANDECCRPRHRACSYHFGVAVWSAKEA